MQGVQFSAMLEVDGPYSTRRYISNDIQISYSYTVVRISQPENRPNWRSSSSVTIRINLSPMPHPKNFGEGLLKLHLCLLFDVIPSPHAIRAIISLGEVKYM